MILESNTAESALEAKISLNQPQSVSLRGAASVLEIMDCMTAIHLSFGNNMTDKP